ncbi:MAG: hypothetical protein GF388_08490 [Candidatus Aegiribacteria sp.]|nr:hypothetical protein [Candidatus Aegiribacteria sp.]MBD3295121.1 hypothetical protein [Candidatus Fermentibacteria bacterium]
MKNMTDSSIYPSPRDVLSIHRETVNTGRWAITGSDAPSVHSVSVFGEKGSRYSVMIMEKSGLKRSDPFTKGCWNLSDRWYDDLKVWFALQWVLEAPGEGRVLLCGREKPQIFHSAG